MIAFEIPYHEMEFSYARSRGPGGQNVNKTNSAAILRWNIFTTQVFDEVTRERLMLKLQNQLTGEGDLIIRSETQRDQDQNRSECIRKLHEILRKALFVPKKRIATKPTRSSQRKRVDSKKIRAEVKQGRQRVKL